MCLLLLSFTLLALVRVRSVEAVCSTFQPSIREQFETSLVVARLNYTGETVTLPCGLQTFDEVQFSYGAVDTLGSYQVLEVFKGDVSAGAESVPLFLATSNGGFLTSIDTKFDTDTEGFLAFLVPWRKCYEETGEQYRYPDDFQPTPYSMSICTAANTPWSQVSKQDQDFLRSGGAPVMQEPIVGNLPVILSTVTSSISSDLPVTYDCTFENQWTPARHVPDYPSGPHWSRPVIASHSNLYKMWEAGVNASPGVQAVAELGSTIEIRNELEAAGAEVMDIELGVVIFPPGVSSQVISGIDIDSMHPHLSAVTMIAPSPDWFSGFHDLNMIDTATSTWFERVVIDTAPYDAGTDSGITYESSDQVTSPQIPIFELTASSVPSSGVFLDSTGRNVLPVARWTCEFAEGVTNPPVENPSPIPVPTVNPQPTPPPVPIRKEAQPSPFRCSGRARGNPGHGGAAGRASRNFPTGCLRRG